MATDARVDLPELRRYMRRARRTCRLATPVQGDVWMRLLLKMLPVNSRFPYLQRERPNAICCTYGCGAIETQQHAFHDCEVVNQVWAFHAQAWRCFGVPFSWASLSDLDTFPLNARGARHEDALRVLWSLLAAAVLGLIWVQHNDVQYSNKAALPAHVWHDTSFVGWMLSVRRWLRLQDPDCPERAAVLAAVRVLLDQPGYQALAAKYPRCLQLAPSFAAG